MPSAGLLLCLLLGLALAIALAAWLLSGTILRPPRMTDARALRLLGRVSPADLGWAFEPVALDLRDPAGAPLRLAAWWIPSPTPCDGACVVVHGFADAKVGALAWAAAVRAAGWNVLAIDLPGHGDSDARAGFGVARHGDAVGQAVDRLRAVRPDATRRLAMLGVSLGACAVLHAAQARDDLHALILDSPFPRFADAARRHARLLGSPDVVARLGTWIAARRAAAPPEPSAPALLAAAAAPTLLILPALDPLLDDADRHAFRAARRPRAADLLRQPQVGHLAALHADPDGYAADVARILRGEIP